MTEKSFEINQVTASEKTIKKKKNQTVLNFVKRYFVIINKILYKYILLK